MDDGRFVFLSQRLGRFFPGAVTGQRAALLELAGPLARFLERGPADVSPQLLMRAERRNQLARHAFLGAVEIVHEASPCLDSSQKTGQQLLCKPAISSPAAAAARLRPDRT